jgi:hypothetical protein
VVAECAWPLTPEKICEAVSAGRHGVIVEFSPGGVNAKSLQTRAAGLRCARAVPGEDPTRAPPPPHHVSAVSLRADRRRRPVPSAPFVARVGTRSSGL